MFLGRLTPLPQFRGNLRERGARSLSNAPPGFRPPLGAQPRAGVCGRRVGAAGGGRTGGGGWVRPGAGARAGVGVTRVHADVGASGGRGGRFLGAKNGGSRAGCVGFSRFGRVGVFGQRARKRPVLPGFCRLYTSRGREVCVVNRVAFWGRASDECVTPRGATPRGENKNERNATP